MLTYTFWDGLWRFLCRSQLASWVNLLTLDSSLWASYKQRLVTNGCAKCTLLKLHFSHVPEMLLLTLPVPVGSTSHAMLYRVELTIGLDTLGIGVEDWKNCEYGEKISTFTPFVPNLCVRYLADTFIPSDLTLTRFNPMRQMYFWQTPGKEILLDMDAKNFWKSISI